MDCRGDGMTFLAIFVVFFVIGTWLAIRCAEASRRIESDITSYLLTIPADEWRDEC